MYKNYHILLIFLLIPFGLFSQTKVLNINDFGAKGDGKNDDYQALQNAFNQAKSMRGSIVKLDHNKIYKISQPIEIYNSIDGNLSKFLTQNTQAVKIKADNITISNLLIDGGAFKFIRIDNDNITIDHCTFTTASYFALIVVTGNNLNIEKSKIWNLNTKERSYAIHSTTGIDNLSLTSNDIKGGILLKNSSQQKKGSYQITGNTIEVDFSRLYLDVKVQNDGVTLYNVSDVYFNDNTISFKDVNRGFKISDLAVTENGKSVISKYPPTNINFNNNIIRADSRNGKQLFDFYSGTKTVYLNTNKIFSTGFKTVFENKTKNDVERLIKLNNNTIHFDSQILYVDGSSDHSLTKNEVILQNNSFIYDAPKFNFLTSKVGQIGDVKFNFLFNIRNADLFVYENNKLSEKDAKLEFGKRYFFYLESVNQANIKQSMYRGLIKFIPKTKDSKLNLSNNINLEKMAQK